MSENLFAYTATNSGYSEGTAGAINGDRAAAATALSAVSIKKIKESRITIQTCHFIFYSRQSNGACLPNAVM